MEKHILVLRSIKCPVALLLLLAYIFMLKVLVLQGTGLAVKIIEYNLIV